MGTAAGPVLRAGIIGAGWIGQRHAETLADRGDVAVSAVCDLDLHRASEVAAGCGGEAFCDWREMLDRASLDAVWVCTPPRAHAEPAVACLERGLALYLEKPIARSPADAGRIVAAAARAQAVCAVGYQWRAVDVIEDLRLALAGRTVGCLVGQSIGGTQSRSWFTDRAAGGGNLLERGSHHIDLARVLAGEVVAVQAAASTVPLAPGRGGDIDDAVTIVLHFATGGIGTIVVAWTSDDLPGSYWAEVITESAALRLDLDPGLPALRGQRRGVGRRGIAHPAVRAFRGPVRRRCSCGRPGSRLLHPRRRGPRLSRWPPQPKRHSIAAEPCLSGHGDARL